VGVCACVWLSLGSAFLFYVSFPSLCVSVESKRLRSRWRTHTTTRFPHVSSFVTIVVIVLLPL
jgi:hypothetical protein